MGPERLPAGSILPAIQGWGSIGAGVYGQGTFAYGGAVAANNFSEDGYGVYGTSKVGVVGESSNGTSGVGVLALGYYGLSAFCNNEPGAVAIIASRGSGGGSWAGDFRGTVSVANGNLVLTGGNFSVTGGTKSFLIDHPLDPTNKTLKHSCVESSEMKNIYTGVATADASGEAVVQMPSYFDALNEDIHYQLTSIGAPAPNLHIQKEMQSGAFAIAGASPSQKVCWVVTGNRKDAFAKANPFIVEEDKPMEQRGFYLDAKSHGASEERSWPAERCRRSKKPRP